MRVRVSTSSAISNPQSAMIIIPHMPLVAALALIAVLAACSSPDPSQMQTPIQYPPAAKGPVVDTYHGTKVPDPYRWLEDADAPETVKWVEAQNALTRGFVDGPVRDGLKKRLTELFNYPRTGIPTKRGDRYFFTHNTGLQPQAVLYVQEGLKGDRRVLLDPNTLTADGTAALTALAVNDTGTLIAYGISKSGSDRQEIYVRDVATGADRPDHIKWAKFTSISWLKDSSGFYYTRFPEPGKVPAGDENYFGKVYFHRLGDDQAKDPLVYERPDDREIVMATSITDDGRTLVITAFKGSSDKSEVLWMDAAKPASRPSPIFTGFKASYQFADAVGTRLFFQTDEKAPLGRVIAVDLPDVSGRSKTGPSKPERLRDRPGRRRQAQRERHRARHAAAALPAQRQQSAEAVRPRWQTVRRDCAAGHRLDHGPVGPDERHGALLRLYVLYVSSRELPVRLHDPGDRRFCAKPRDDRSGRLRDEAGLVSLEGRHEGLDVSRPPEGPRARRQPSCLPDRLRRLQHQPDAGLRSVHVRLARPRRCLRARQPARRRRVRRGLAPGGYVREETDRVRRFHRRRRNG